jgi:hypothetical protein
MLMRDLSWAELQVAGFTARAGMGNEQCGSVALP